MTTAKRLLTADDFLALPDDGKYYELVRGELVEADVARCRRAAGVGRAHRHAGIPDCFVRGGRERSAVWH